MMECTLTKDERGFPVIKWNEPKYEDASFLGIFTVKNVVYWPARAYLVDVARDEPLFAFTTDHFHRRRGAGAEMDCSAFPLRSLKGFEVKTSDELYSDGTTARPKNHPDVDTYRDPLVIYAVRSPDENGNIILPLTMTCAPWVDVTKLHAMLNDTFILKRAALLRQLEDHRRFAAAAERSAKSTKIWEEVKASAVNVNGRGFAKVTIDAPKPDYKPPFLATLTTLESKVGLGKIEPLQVQQQGTDYEKYVVVGQSWTTCVADSAEQYCFDLRTALFYPASHYSKPCGIEVFWSSYKGHCRCSSVASQLEDVKIFSSRDIQIPPDYIVRAEAVKSDDALVLCMVFSDGLHLPLSFTVKTPMETLMAWRNELLRAAQTVMGVPVSASTVPIKSPTNDRHDPI